MKAVIYGPGEDESPQGMYRAEFENEFDHRFSFEVEAGPLPDFDEPGELAAFFEHMAESFEAFARADVEFA